MSGVRFRSLPLLLVAACAARAQVLLDPADSRAALVIETLENALRVPEAKPLTCVVTPRTPRLNFSFRYEAGYRFSVPVHQYKGAGNILLAVLRITPQTAGATPFYLVQGLPLQPLSPQVTGNIIAAGGYFLGEGKYKVAFRLEDQLGRACRREWNVELKLSRQDRRAKPPLAAGQVRTLSVDAWTRAAVEARSARPFRAAILLHAAPLWPRAAALGGLDQFLLLTTLTSLLDRSEILETSIVAFNLAQQKEIFRAERLDPRAFRGLRTAINDLKLGAIDVRVLSQASRQGEFLARLLRREIEAGPDAVILIGPRSLESGKVARDALEASVSAPPLFGLTLQFYGRMMVFPDILEQTVKRARGRVFLISHPRDLAAALRTIGQTLAARPPAPAAER